jgi:tetratricopeptide (TPR) repeat protein
LSPLNLVIAVVVLAALVIGGVVFWQHHNAKSKESAKVDAAIADSQAAYSKADYTNALNLVGGMAEKATSSKQKAQVYQMQAQAATGAGKLAEAARFYELKHLADPSTAKADAYTLGNIYQRLGQNDRALLQYRLALEYAKGQKSQYTSDAPAIQASIDELENKK